MRALVLACALVCTSTAHAGAAPVDTAPDAKAAYRLALQVRNGDGVAPDPASARLLLTQAAEGGVPAAMFVLSNMLAAGEGGPADAQEARRWLELAGDLGYPEALQQLAMLEPDPRKAELLMRQAAHAMMHRR
ncbi:hypothetical protein LK540_02350 [Massilia sp. IC2-278]|uniref:tetratricopeptide repeat protein n=1 Tax=Massilia sp. IC2-278 TaxID=2887200 RepID=UPI00226D26DA|nr:hypothetical protein [Massilia sp. IC2-278]MCC2959267.1 hypothetical protein [Massilia sp. IC2-278]